MNLKKLFWWKYQPADEREQALYSRAYQHAMTFLTTVISIIAWFLVTETFITLSWVKFLFYPRVLGLILFVVIFSAYMIGARQLRHQELQLKLPLYSAMSNFFILFLVFTLLIISFSFFGGNLIGNWPF